MAQNRMLYTELTTFRTVPSPATTQIISVIQRLAIDACKSRRFTQGVCLLIARARDICDHIHDLINDFQQNRDLDVFDRYTQMIENLEERLFEALFLTRMEMGETIDAEIVNPRVISCWAENRNLLQDIISDLHSEEDFGATEPQWAVDANIAFHHDDIVWLSAVCNHLEQLSPAEGSDMEQSAQCVKHLGDIYSALQRKPVESSSLEEAPGLALKCAMRIYLMRDALINNRSTDEIKGVGTVEVWEEASRSVNSKQKLSFGCPEHSAFSVLSDILDFVKGQSNSELQDIGNAWEKLELKLLLGYSAKAKASGKAAKKLLLKDKKIFDIEKEDLAGLRRGSSEPPRSSTMDPMRQDSVDPTANIDPTRRKKNTITYAYVAPGYLLFQHHYNRLQLQIQQLENTATSIQLSDPLLGVAVDSTSKKFAYITAGEGVLLNHNSIPPTSGEPEPFIFEKQVDQIFWINSDSIGLIVDDGGLKDVYEYRVSDPNPNLDLLFTLDGTVKQKGRLYHSVVSDGDEEWIAINMFKDEERYVQVWSRTELTSLVVKGAGTITRLNLGGKPLTLLITADRPDKQGQISLVAYELGHRPIKRPFRIFDKLLEARELPGDPSYVHVFEKYRVGLVVTSTGAAAAAFLFDIHTGQKLQSIQEHVKWQGTFSRDLVPEDEAESSDVGLLVLDPLGNVDRMTIDEALLNKEWRDWVKTEEDDDGSLFG
ncbi:hypothetical protein FRC02_011462 [Tulasnella sp. 418]|nr:hypothetical protein FRC02_011462 [Tulasnella sp. 418]